MNKDEEITLKKINERKIKIFNTKNKKQKNFLSIFSLIIFLINIGLILYIIINEKVKKGTSNISNEKIEKLLKINNELSLKVSLLNKLIELKIKENNENNSQLNETIINKELNETIINKELNETIINKELNETIINKGTNETLSDTNITNNNTIEIFNETINEKYIQEQYNFCSNQNDSYNKEFEDKIKIYNITFRNTTYEMYIYKKRDYGISLRFFACPHDIILHHQTFYEL